LGREDPGDVKFLGGKVAVVTGGAGGIGKALCEELLKEGMKVVLSDVRSDAVNWAATELSALGEVVGVTTDVSSWASVQALADSTYERFGVCHVLCNNAGVGAPSAKPWETTVNDWKWVHGVNVMGVVHGVLAFVPRMIGGGEEGHVVNTSSGDGGIAPMPTASVYAASKAAVTSYTETLASQFETEGTRLKASIFYPSGGLLKTGLWVSDRTRPPELAREKPRTTEAMTVEKLEAMAEKDGYQLPWQDLNELARIVVDGIKDESFIFMIGRETIGDTMRDRATYLEKGECPPHHSGMLG
jgi:NAD(P)-dependent dehydrogenase (short-subunit alcohol dehydrogenase family)